MKLNEKMILVMVAVLTLFLVTITAVIWVYEKPSDDYIAWKKEQEKPEQAVASRIEKKTLRGKIYDRNGNVLAYSEPYKDKDENGKEIGSVKQRRVYNDGELFAHTIGYYREGKEDKYRGIEKRYDSYLTKLSAEDEKEAMRIDRENSDDYEFEGASLELTLDLGMTAKAKEVIENTGTSRYKIEKGAIVVMNPKTGEIYCMYSHPTFDPNPEALAENMGALGADKNEPLTSRATSIYPPGSVYKIVTALAAVENDKDDFVYEDKISETVGGVFVPNYKRYKPEADGKINLKKAIKKSSNVYFANLAKNIGNEKYHATAGKLSINKTFKTDIPVSDASLLSDENEKNKKELTTGELATSGFGQGTAMMSPLHMAMVASTVANDGVLKTPYLVKKAMLSNGEEVSLDKFERKTIVVTEKSVYDIVKGMVMCVEDSGGTANSARLNGLKIAGKTGTAQNSGGADHTWFIGFAPADDPQVAICVMGQNTGGGGGSVCGPVAKAMFKYCLENGFIKQ